MLDISRQRAQSAFEARAWIVEFQESTKREQDDAIVVVEPRNVTAVLTPIEVEQAKQTADRAGALTVLFLPLEAAQSLDAGQEAQAWVAGREIAPGRIVRASSRTARAIWTDTRAVVYAGDEHMREALDALVRFTVAEREIAKQEQAIRDLWPSISVDAELALAPEASNASQRERVQDLTRLITGLQASSLRVWIALEQLDPALSDPSKRLFAELSMAAAHEDRQELLDDPIEFAADQYEAVNTRLIEHRQASREAGNFRLELVSLVLIVVLLLLELLTTYGIRLFPPLTTP